MNHYDDRELAKQEERMIVAVMSRLKNELNTQNQSFTKIVNDHAIGVQRVYDQFTMLGKRVLILEQEIVCREAEEEIEDEIELMRCPFCSGPANIEEDQDEYYVQCDNCACRSPNREEKIDTIEAWNERS